MRLRDPDQIRTLLNADRVWSVYALGDLQPAAFAKAKWFVPDLTLVYSAYGTCILFAMGERSVTEGLAHVSWPVHLQLQPRAMELMERLTVVEKQTPMWRMGWNGDRSEWVGTERARRLTNADVPALIRLYADGDAHGEAPDFFFPSMVDDGVFFGIFEGDEIVAAAGTHLYAPGESAAAIGNVYTHRGWRGRGLGKAATCATLGELARLETVGLNVRASNAAAIRVYEALGFRKHCEFFEGLAARLRGRHT